MKFDCLARPLAAAVAVLSCAALPASAQTPTRAPATSPPPAVATVPGMPPVPNAANLYSETAADKMNPAVAGDLPRVYVPHVKSNDVYVINPATLKVVDKFKVGINPQHVVPSWDMRTLWVANNAEGRKDGSLTPVDPTTGKPGKAIPVDDPYNMYSTPDGKSVIVVAEAFKRLDFRHPRTLALEASIDTPRCNGINHADFSIDGRYAIFTCEFDGTVVKIDLVERKVIGYIQLIKPGKVPLMTGAEVGQGELRVGGGIRDEKPAFAQRGCDGKATLGDEVLQLRRVGHQAPQARLVRRAVLGGDKVRMRRCETAILLAGQDATGALEVVVEKLAVRKPPAGLAEKDLQLGIMQNAPAGKA